MAKRGAPVSQARRQSSRTPMIAAVVVVVLLAVVVVGGVLLSGGEEGSAGGRPIPTVAAPAQFPTTVEGGVVVAGERAPRTLEVYEDALCPACQQLEEVAGDGLARAVAEGRLQVRYHMVNLLESRSTPAGYSSAAGNAIVCAAENGAFPAVHASLYAAQPQEGGRGYTTAQLADLGPAVGAGPGYAECVNSGRHVAAIGQNYQQALNDPAISSDGRFGTPTLVLDGQVVEANSPEFRGLLGS